MVDVAGYSSSPLLATLYDYVPPYVARDDVHFYVELSQALGPTTLELGCGTGRILLPTARAGCPIVGLDASPDMLKRAREKLSAEPEEVQKRVQLVEGDMCDFSMDRTFGLVTVPFRAFQHLLTVEAQLACLRAVYEHLDPGGTFVLDLFDPNLEVLVADRSEEFGDEPEFELPTGERVVRKHRILAVDRHAQVLDVELVYYLTDTDGAEQRVVHAFKMRYLFRYEADHLLARAGFEVHDVFADHSRTPFGSKHPSDLIVLAKKPVRVHSKI